MKYKFKVGDKVRLYPKNTYYSSNDGVILARLDGEKDFTTRQAYVVLWKNVPKEHQYDLKDDDPDDAFTKIGDNVIVGVGEQALATEDEIVLEEL